MTTGTSPETTPKSETPTLIQYNIAREWLKSISIPIWQIDKSEEEGAKEIIFRFKDKAYTLTDAISFVVMKKLGIKKAFAFDRHFQQFGYQFFE